MCRLLLSIHLVNNDLPYTSIEMASFNPFKSNCKCSLCFLISFIISIIGFVMLFALGPVVKSILANVRRLLTDIDVLCFLSMSYSRRTMNNEDMYTRTICSFVLSLQKLAIIDGRTGHQFWKNPPAIVHRKMYIWHCANPTEVQNGGIPEMIERGPYVYRYVD
jgi:hypothetical protein